MKHKDILISLLLLLSATTYSQESFKKSLEAISTDLCSKLADKGKKKVVVLFVTDINKAQTKTGKYIADVVSFYIVNNQNGFSVFDRENLSGIAEAKKLISEGYIDANNAKELGKILSVEAIVVGNYTELSSSLSLTLKALDVNDGFVLAQSLNDLPLDDDLAALLGISTSNNSGNNLINKGFGNTPLNSNESYNNPETVNKDCEIKHTGDYCFYNGTNELVYVELKLGMSFIGDFTLKPNETQCIYNKAAKSIDYSIYNTNANNYYSKTVRRAEGYILIEECESKTFVIK